MGVGGGGGSSILVSGIDQILLRYLKFVNERTFYIMKHSTLDVDSICEGRHDVLEIFI